MSTAARILLFLCGMVTAAHFLRSGGPWLTLPALLPPAAAFFPRLLPRPLLVLNALAATALSTGQEPAPSGYNPIP